MGRQDRAKSKTAGKMPTVLDVYAGDYLLSHRENPAVTSAQRGLTSVFGMGTGVAPAVRSPAKSNLEWAA